MLAKILAYNKSALCLSASFAFNFVSLYTSSDVWLQHLLKLEIRQQEPVSYIDVLRGPLHSHSFFNSQLVTLFLLTAVYALSFKYE